MKYCSKCGNELMDEAVICPKCGCPVGNSTNQRTDSKLNKIKTALFLNITAFAIAFFSIVSYLLIDGKSDSTGSQNTIFVLLGLLALITLSFVLCIVNMARAKKGHTQLGLVWAYVVSVVFTLILITFFAPLFFFIVICGIGSLFPIPPILQIIAAVKLIQATKE